MSYPTIERIREIPDGLSEEEEILRKKVSKDNIKLFVDLRSIMCVSCWHISNLESDAMWGRYTSNEGCLAIKSSFARFKNSLLGAEQNIYGTAVEYIDYQTKEIEVGNIFQWVRHKKKEYEQDQEFRGICMGAIKGQLGESVSVNVGDLISEVVVSPNSPLWFAELVSTVTRRYGIEASVRKSGLALGPEYLESLV